MSIDMTKVWAHRGASAYAPENTIPAFQMAMEMGADGLELDVHESSDGKLMVIHDERIDRTSNGTGRVVDMTCQQLQPLFNVYSRRLRLRPAPCPVPTVCPAAAGKVHSRRIGDNRNRIHRGVHSKPAHGAKRMGLFRQAVQSLQTDMPRFRAALGSAFAAHSAAVRSYKIGAVSGALYLYL